MADALAVLIGAFSGRLGLIVVILDAEAGRNNVSRSDGMSCRKRDGNRTGAPQPERWRV